MTTKNELDCVEMKRAASLHIYEATRDLSFEERCAYWRARSEAALKLREKLSKERANA